jgi:hypothetical protein
MVTIQNSRCVYEIVIKPWNSYRNKIENPIITDHILKTKSGKNSILKKNNMSKPISMVLKTKSGKKFNFKKNNMSKPISMVIAKSWGGSIFSEYKKKKVTATLGFP